RLCSARPSPGNALRRLGNALRRLGNARPSLGNAHPSRGNAIPRLGRAIPTLSIALQSARNALPDAKISLAQGKSLHFPGNFAFSAADKGGAGTVGGLLMGQCPRRGDKHNPCLTSTSRLTANRAPLGAQKGHPTQCLPVPNRSKRRSSVHSTLGGRLRPTSRSAG